MLSKTNYSAMGGFPKLLVRNKKEGKVLKKLIKKSLMDKPLGFFKNIINNNARFIFCSFYEYQKLKDLSLEEQLNLAQELNHQLKQVFLLQGSQLEIHLVQH